MEPLIFTAWHLSFSLQCGNYKKNPKSSQLPAYFLLDTSSTNVISQEKRASLVMKKNE